MKLSSFLLLLTLAGNSFAAAFMELDFNLKDCKDSRVEGEPIQALANVTEDPRYWKALLKEEKKEEDQENRLQGVIYILPDQEKKVSSQPPKAMEVMGMSARTSLLMSRDATQESGCSYGHDQGDMSNRWCHSAIARTFSATLEKAGVSPVLSSILGGVFWMPKEFFYDLNASAHDIPVTFVSKLGTKSTTFEVTVFGDAFYPKYFGKDFKPFKESTPFITIRRRI